MQIQPVQPVDVELKCGDVRMRGMLLQLTDDELLVTSKEYLEKDNVISFIARYFRGEAIIKKVMYSEYLFTYTLAINSIRFQPGLLINTQL